MTSSAPTHTIIDEINLRQDEVLSALDDLNGRIEAVLAQFNPAGGADNRASADNSP